MEQLLQTPFPDADRLRHFVQRKLSARGGDEPRCMGGRSLRRGCAVGLAHPALQSGMQYCHACGGVRRVSHALQQPGPFAAPQRVQVHGRPRQLAGRQPQQAGRCAGTQRDRHAVDLPAQAHQCRRGRGADHDRGRTADVAEIEDQPNCPIGQHAFEHFVSRRHTLSAQQDVRDMPLQRPAYRKGPQRARGRIRLRPLHRVIVEAEEESFAHGMKCRSNATFYPVRGRGAKPSTPPLT
nr:hypothetical protein [Variovorax sp. WDL1]